mmetsp:Transcript_424/g.955  ORF Transcript_424/g.955 Transcript_424/m.955 type:complete len:104 (+) Transcript_424:336-647(+)
MDNKRKKKETTGFRTSCLRPWFSTPPKFFPVLYFHNRLSKQWNVDSDAQLNACRMVFLVYRRFLSETAHKVMTEKEKKKRLMKIKQRTQIQDKTNKQTNKQRF